MSVMLLGDWVFAIPMLFLLGSMLHLAFSFPALVSFPGILATLDVVFWKWYAEDRKARLRQLMNRLWPIRLRDELVAIMATARDHNRVTNDVLKQGISILEKDGKFKIDMLYPRAALNELRRLSEFAGQYDVEWVRFQSEVEEFAKTTKAHKGHVLGLVLGPVEYRQDPSDARRYIPYDKNTGCPCGPAVDHLVAEREMSFIQKMVQESAYVRGCNEGMWKTEVEERASHIVEVFDKFVKDHVT